MCIFICFITYNGNLNSVVPYFFQNLYKSKTLRTVHIYITVRSVHTHVRVSDTVTRDKMKSPHNIAISCCFFSEGKGVRGCSNFLYVPPKIYVSVQLLRIFENYCQSLHQQREIGRTLIMHCILPTTYRQKAHDRNYFHTLSTMYFLSIEDP